jgi:hypothetical protein
LKAHTVALRALPLPAVERKKARIEGLVANATMETEKPLIEHLLPAFGDEMNHAIAEPQAVIHQRLCFAPTGFGLADDNVDIVFLESFQPLSKPRGAQIDQLAIDARAPVTEPAGSGNHLFVKSLSPADKGAQNHDFFASVRTGNPIKNLAAT